MTITVNTRNATVTEQETLTTGSVGIPLTFCFSPDWDNLSKIACFKTAWAAVDVALTDDSTTIPADVLTTAGEMLYIGVYGALSDGTVAIPTVWVNAGTIRRGAMPSGVDPSEPTPSWVAQVQQIASDAMDTANEVKAEADAGEFDGEPGEDGYSPSATVTQTEDGAIITITDKSGTTTAEVKNGETPSVAVESVNGKTGAVEIDASDVGALPDTATLDNIPDGTTYKRPTGAQIQQIADNAAALQTQSGEIDALESAVDRIEGKIPTQASASNQLADKDFVNSSINSAAAFFRGAFETYAALTAVQWQTSDPTAANYVSNNDYAYVADDETHNDEAWRYIYVLETGGQSNGWQPQFRVNESPLTAAQLAALNSGATAALIEQISTNAAAIALKQGSINASGILKGSGNGQVSSAVAGTDYLAPSALTAYRTASAQDTIDQAQNTAISGKITAPSSPASGAFLVWNGSAWAAQTLATWQGGSY